MKTLWALLLSICIVPMASEANANIGQVSTLKGSNAQLERSNSKSVLSSSNGIESMDLIVMGSNTSSEIKFVDDTNVKITANSRLLIDDFVYDPNNKSAGKLGLKVALGTVRYASGQIAKNAQQNVNIRTPTATIAVRGTDFSVTVDETGGSTVVLLPSCDDEEKLKKFEIGGNCVTGSITVTTPGGSVTLDKPFTATYVQDASASPTPPVSVPMDLNAVTSNDVMLRVPETVKAAVAAQEIKKDTGKEPEEQKAEQDEQQKVTVDQNNQAASESAIAKQSEAEQQLIVGNPDSIPRNPDLTAFAGAVTGEEPQNSCWPFTSCGNEKGRNYYIHEDDKNNIISLRTAELQDNVNYNISVNSNDLSSRMVGNGTSTITVRQWNR